MTRTAVKETFDEIADHLYQHAMNEVRPVRAVTGVSIPGADRLARSAARDTIRSEMRSIRNEMQSQRDIVLEYTEARREDDTDYAEQLQDEFLRTNPVDNRVSRQYRHRKDDLEDELLDHLDAISDDFAPLLASEHDDFWDAATAVYDRDAAQDVIDRHLDQVEAFKTYQHLIDIELELDLGLFGSKTVDVTDEAIRVLDSGKDTLQDRLYRDLEAAYSDGKM